MSVSRPSLKILLCMFMEGGTCSLGRFDFDDGEDELTLVPAQGNRQYKRNLGNTVLTVLLTVPLMTALYSIMWYQDLNTQVLQITSDTVVGLPYIPPFSLHTFIPSTPNRSPSDQPLTLIHIVISQLPLHRSTPTPRLDLPSRAPPQSIEMLSGLVYLQRYHVCLSLAI